MMGDKDAATPGAPPDRSLTFSERVRAFKEDLPPGDDAAQIIAAKAEGLYYQPPICHTCGRTQDLIRRFNGGNPMIHYEAMCGCDDEQQGEDVQAGLLPGREGDPADLVEGDAAGDEGGVGEGRGAGAGSAPARGEVGAGVDHGSGTAGSAAGDVRRVGGGSADAPQPLEEPLTGVDAERRRIWAAILGWTEVASRLGDDGTTVVTIEGTEFRPLAPFFDELHAMVFPDEYLSDEEVRGQTEGGVSP